jgi:hypothetical protein
MHNLKRVHNLPKPNCISKIFGQINVLFIAVYKKGQSKSQSFSMELNKLKFIASKRGSKNH